MKKTILLTLILALGLTSASLGVGDTWTEKALMPTARLALATSLVNGKIYAIGGYAAANAPHLRTVEEYDPEMDTWIQKADMPTARSWLSASTVDGKIYAIGGQRFFGAPGIRAVEEYDPATDTWTTKADMPTERFEHSTSVVDGKIYAIGGVTGPGGLSLSTVEVYDPSTDTWTTKANMPTARGILSTCVVDGKIYAIGAVRPSTPPLSKVEMYDPMTDTWTTKADMPTARGALGTSAVNGRIYAIGGRTSSTALTTVEKYDPATDTWTIKADMPTPRWGLSTSVVNGKIYIIGGAITGAGSHPGVRTVYEYDAIPPLVVDFNGDGIVDCADICMMVEHWHTDEPFYDIAPAPFGDGIVDTQDLVALSEYLSKDVNDSTLAAHWALDETEGEIAYDSAGLNDAFVVGGALWQPSGGQVDGALEFDGVDDSLIAGPVLNPANGPLSVFAWVQGGAPGQVIISGAAGANWLMLDAEGKLMTELTSPGRSATPLLSGTTITDGNWHRIGFVWDGSTRTLYVDGVAVAQDMQDSLESSSNGLYIGTGKAMQPGTYWSGMIDDVRIYNRAVSP
ncbi:MAG: Kelch repeat-containing protein [Planctomycetota bacterium]|jgi:N-acetylneuraminic acid mutarotase